MWQNFKDWLAKPFKDMRDMSAWDLFMVVGLVIVCVIIWRIILVHLFETIE